MSLFPSETAPAVPRASSRKRKTSERASQEERRIMEFAAKLFLERGYGATTVDDLAMEMNATKGYIYYYFSSKPELFVRIYQWSTDELLRRLASHIPADADPATKLHKALLAHISLDIEGSPFLMVANHRRWVLEQADFPGRYLKQIRAKREKFLRIYRDIIAEGIASGFFLPGDPRESTELLLGTIAWLPTWRRNGASQMSPAEIAMRIARMVRRGDGMADGGELVRRIEA